MGEVVQFEREPWQRRVCKMTGMACMATVESCCICKHQDGILQPKRLVGITYLDADLIQFAKSGAPPERPS